LPGHSLGCSRLLRGQILGNDVPIQLRMKSDIVAHQTLDSCYTWKSGSRNAHMQISWLIDVNSLDITELLMYAAMSCLRTNTCVLNRAVIMHKCVNVRMYRAYKWKERAAHIYPSTSLGLSQVSSSGRALVPSVALSKNNTAWSLMSSYLWELAWAYPRCRQTRSL